MAAPVISEPKVEAFVTRFVTDMSAAMSMPLVALGARLGLYKAMDGAGPVTPAELAERAGIGERYAREWLANQAAGGYVEHDPAADRYVLPPEHALALADESSPLYVLGICDMLEAAHADEDRLAAAMAADRGLGWHEHDPRLYAGTERFFRPGYQRDLVGTWIPALGDVADLLAAGIRVADVGCGHGASTILMAQAFPASTFVGFDYHDASIARAREAASSAGVADHAHFRTARATEVDGGPYGLIAMFDCLHDMGDPVGAARHLLGELAPDGTLMVVEPFAGDTLEDNEHPVGRLFYAASTMLCCPNALDQGGTLALGAQAGPARLRAVLEEAGFGRVRVATQTPFNLVLEARR